MNRVRTWAYINQTIVVILVVVTVRGDIAVVDPDVVGFFYFISLAYGWSEMEILTDSKSIAIIGQNLLNA